MQERSSGKRLFFKQAREDFLQTGAIAPSSRFLAKAILSTISPSMSPMRVLEAGAGTGALTASLLERLPRGSSLDIYEINPIFARHLATRFEHPALEGGKPIVRPAPSSGNGRIVEVNVRNRDVREIPAEPRYDVILSGLPLNNFEPSLVRGILDTLFRSLKPGGVLSFFEYLLIRELKSMATGRRERRRLRRVGRVTGGFLDKYEFRRESVLLNIPPAVVHHLRKPV